MAKEHGALENEHKRCFCYKMQCKIEFLYASHCVSKNLTPRRMLKTSFLIAQIIGWNNSFQNMYDMLKAKWTVWPGKLILLKKKTPKNA